MADPMAGSNVGGASPYRNGNAVTPSDVTILGNATAGNVTRALFVGSAGNVTVQMIDGGANLTFFNVPAGTTLDVQVSKVMANGTGASNITALW